MIRISCDHCDSAINRDEGRWIGVDVTEPIEHHPDPVEQMNQAEGELIASVATLHFGADHEYHFCGEGCLSAWAMDRQFGGES